jgi:hypothetical protein
MRKRQIIFALDPGSVNIGGAIIINGIPKKLFSIKGIPSRIKNNKNSFNHDMNNLIQNVLSQFEEIIETNNVTHVVWEIPPSFGGMNQREMVQSVCTTLKVVSFQKKLNYNSFTPNYWHFKLLERAKNVSKQDVRRELLERYPKLQQFANLPPDPFDAAAMGIVAHGLNDWENPQDLDS